VETGTRNALPQRVYVTCAGQSLKHFALATGLPLADGPGRLCPSGKATRSRTAWYGQCGARPTPVVPTRSELWAQRHEWRHDTAYAFVQEVFEQLDTDGSGTLSKSEVAGLKELVEKYVEKKRSSQNPEDMVTYEEFEAKFQPGGECKPDTSRVFIELESTLGIAWA
jgi:hypothetical protein